ncbi:MAG: F0F1 ATP synthase subunit B [Nitriliruptorales bacterium]
MSTLLAAGGTQLILPAPAEMVWGTVAFILFLVIMYKFAFPKINGVLEERIEAIQGRLEYAQEQVNKAERMREQYESQLADAKSEANRIIEDARQTAQSLRQDIIEKAEAEAEAIMRRAQSEVRSERDRTVQQLRAEMGRLSVQLAEKIVQRELDDEAHEGLIDDYIETLAGTNGSGPSSS